MIMAEILGNIFGAGLGCIVVWASLRWAQKRRRAKQLEELFARWDSMLEKKP